MMSTISVIIPVYNTDEFLEQSITSVLNQTYQNVEIVIVNDNSDDESKQIIDNMVQEDNRINAYHLQVREGAGNARNVGIAKSTGDYIYFLDSDDYLPPTTLELLIKNIGDHPMIRGRMRSTNLSSSFVVVFEGLFKRQSFRDNKYNLIQNNSAVNFLFKKDFIIHENLTYATDVEVYSDLSFMVPALLSVREVPYLREALYFKRKRNDPISNPSLHQLDEDVRIRDFLHVYNELKDKYNDRRVNDFLDKHFLNFYRKDIITYFKANQSIDLFFKTLSNSIKRVNIDILKQYNWVLKREARALFEGDIGKYKKTNKRHHFLRDVREGIKTKRKFFIFLYRRGFMKLRMKENLVFFESFLGKSYSDSPKYIYEHMIANDMNYKFVWSVNERKSIPGDSIQVKRFSLKYFYYLARAKYWISNSRLPRYLDKRKGNVYLQTWHGTPLKTLVFDIADIYSADPAYKQNFYSQSRRWDYLSSPNTYSSNIFRRAFKYDRELLEYGYPRNDILYQKNTSADIAHIKRKMGIPTDKKVILYAPTWRDDEFFGRGKYKFTLQLELDQLQKLLTDDYIVLLRMHYFISNELDVSEYTGFVYDFSEYDDIAELYLATDVLITDYSSVFFDFAHLRRPILYYTYDLEKYRDQLRGFYIDLENEAPGPLLKTTKEVIDAINDLDTIKEAYQTNYAAFYEKYCKWDDGNAAEHTVKAVFKQQGESKA